MLIVTLGMSDTGGTSYLGHDEVIAYTNDDDGTIVHVIVHKMVDKHLNCFQTE